MCLTDEEEEEEEDRAPRASGIKGIEVLMEVDHPAVAEATQVAHTFRTSFVHLSFMPIVLWTVFVSHCLSTTR